MENRKVNILGTEWELVYKEVSEDDYLEDRDGYCDRSVKRMVVAKERKDSGFADYQAYQKASSRHEIIHAFMIESGLDGNWEHANKFGPDETTVDWFAIQSPKIFKVFKELDLL